MTGRQNCIVREMAAVHLEQAILEKIKGYADLRYDLVQDAYSEFLYDSLFDLINKVVVSGNKADFFR